MCIYKEIYFMKLGYAIMESDKSKSVGTLQAPRQQPGD